MALDTQLERGIALKIFKDFTTKYNAGNIAIELKKTRAGTLKALKNLEKKRIVIGEAIGKARIYKLNLADDFVKKNIELLLEEEARTRQRWINEFEELSKKAEILILFGSIIRDEKKAHDLDLLIVLDTKQNKEIDNMINDKNNILTKRIHPVKQTKGDLTNNLKKHDKVLLNALKFGIVLHGYKQIVDMIENVTR